jgi:hypothetical protein
MFCSALSPPGKDASAAVLDKWACASCTLENASFARQCEVCESPRPEFVDQSTRKRPAATQGGEQPLSHKKVRRDSGADSDTGPCSGSSGGSCNGSGPQKKSAGIATDAKSMLALSIKQFSGTEALVVDVPTTQPIGHLRGLIASKQQV